MQEFTTLKENGFVYNKNNEIIWVTPWGKNGVRVRITRESDFRDLPHGLLDNPPTPADTQIEVEDSGITLVNGEITMTLTIPRLGRAS